MTRHVLLACGLRQAIACRRPQLPPLPLQTMHRAALQAALAASGEAEWRP